MLSLIVPICLLLLGVLLIFWVLFCFWRGLKKSNLDSMQLMSKANFWLVILPTIGISVAIQVAIWIFVLEAAYKKPALVTALGYVLVLGWPIILAIFLSWELVDGSISKKSIVAFLISALHYVVLITTVVAIVVIGVSGRI